MHTHQQYTKALAEAAAKHLVEIGAENYLGDVFSVTLDDSDIQFEITVITQKVGAKTPAEVAATARAELASFLETTAKTCEALGIDLKQAQTEEGKPSDVLLKYVERLRDEQRVLFGDYGATLRPFVELMRKELEANSHKGDREGWLSLDKNQALLELHYHVGKLHYAAGHADADRTTEFAADTANCCMMLLDVLGLLPTDAEPEVKP